MKIAQDWLLSVQTFHLPGHALLPCAFFVRELFCFFVISASDEDADDDNDLFLS